jgi:hypothetical protein
MRIDPSESYCGSAKDTAATSFTIFSVEQPEFSAVEILTRHQAMAEILRERRVPHKVVTGFYEGRAEQSYVVSTCDFHAHLEECPLLSDQESVLRLSPANERGERKAALVHYRDPDLGRAKRGVEDLEGVWQQITSEEAKNLGGWTFDPSTGQWFGVVVKPKVALPAIDIDPIAYDVIAAQPHRQAAE